MADIKILPDNTPVAELVLSGRFLIVDPVDMDPGVYLVTVDNMNVEGQRTIYHQYRNLTALEYREATIKGAVVGDMLFYGTGGGSDIELPEGGTPGVSFLGLADDGDTLEWRTPEGSGDMAAAIYDPQEIEADAFDRSNHTGTQDASTIDGLSDVATSNDYDDLDNLPELGTAAAEDVGTMPGNVVQVDEMGRLPSLDGSNLTNLPGGMSATTYDPQEIEDDAFDLATHTGVLSLAQGGTGLNAANEAALRAGLGLAIGTDVQAYSAILAATTGIFTSDMQSQLEAVDLIQLQEDVNSLTSGIQLIGLWDASSGEFPGLGAAQPGYVWVVEIPGTVDDVEFFENDRIMALVPNASTSEYGANWHRLAYTDQVISVAGKTGVVTLEASDISGLGTLAALNTINNSNWSGTDLSVANGGTGASDASAARTNLGLAIGTNVQAWSAILDATEESFLTSHADKLDLISVTNPIDLDLIDVEALEEAIEDIETALENIGNVMSLQGVWDASSGSFPGGGTAQTGYTWIVETGGTVDGVEFSENDQIVAITDNASTTTYAANWHRQGFTGAVTSVAGKTGAVTLVAADIGGLGALATKSTINNADWSGTVLSVANGGTGATNAANARINLGLEIGVNVAAYNARIATLAPSSAAGSFVRSTGAAGYEFIHSSDMIEELGLGALSELDTINNTNWSGTDLAVVNGGTGASNPSGARANLGLAIGTNVQAYSPNLSALAGLGHGVSRFIVSDGSTWTSSSLSATKAILEIPEPYTLPAATDSAIGGVELATLAEVRASDGATVLLADHLDTASAFVSISYNANLPVNWASGYNFSSILTGDTEIQNPTNAIPGQSRTIVFQSNSGVARTITFDSNFGGDLPVIDYVTDTLWVAVQIYCITTTHFIVSIADASPPA